VLTSERPRSNNQARYVEHQSHEQKQAEKEIRVWLMPNPVRQPDADYDRERGPYDCEPDKNPFENSPFVTIRGRKTLNAPYRRAGPLTQK
jgi:hypothetical protein